MDCHKPDHFSFYFESKIGRLAISNAISLLRGFILQKYFHIMHIDICMRMFTEILFII